MRLFRLGAGVPVEDGTGDGGWPVMSTQPGAAPRLGRVGAWMGIAFVVLFIVGLFIQPTPKHNSSATEWALLYAKSSHRATEIVGAYLVVFGLLAFVWFAARLRHLLGDNGGLVVLFGSVFATVGMVSALVGAAIAGAKVFTKAPVPSGPLAQQLSSLSGGLLVVPGALAAGLFVGIASYLARRNDALPGWLTIAGYIVAVLQLAGVLFFPLLLVPLWVLAVSIARLRRAGKATAAA